MVKIGAILLIGGLAALGIYALVEIVQALFAARGVPLVLKVALPAIGVGLVLLLGAVARERYRAAKDEPFKEVER